MTGIVECGDGARHDFFVERPQIFERAAAASEDQHIDSLLTIEKLHGADDFRGGAIALDAHGIQRQMHVVEAAAQDAHDVADGRARRRSDEADAAREHRQRLFSLGGKQAFGFQAFFQLVEGELQRAQADRLDVLDVNLIFAAGFVDADGTAYGDVQAVLGAELHSATGS